MDEFTKRERRHRIAPGLHVNVRGGILHGIQAGGQGCEVFWAFGSARIWEDVPYVFLDAALENKNIHVPETELALPVGVSNTEEWGLLRAKAAEKNSRYDSGGDTSIINQSALETADSEL